MDVLPEVPPQQTPVVLVQASATQQGPQVDRTIGICYLATNDEGLKRSAINSFGPLGAAWGYLRRVEGRNVALSGTMKVLDEPKHGVLEPLFDKEGKHVSYLFVPTSPEYVGEDSATFLVEIGGFSVKEIYFFNIMRYVAPGSEEYDPYEDKRLCPNGDVWRIASKPGEGAPAPTKP